MSWRSLLVLTLLAISAVSAYYSIVWISMRWLGNRDEDPFGEPWFDNGTRC